MGHFPIFNSTIDPNGKTVIMILYGQRAKFIGIHVIGGTDYCNYNYRWSTAFYTTKKRYSILNVSPKKSKRKGETRHFNYGHLD